jgi:hypothetical protein
MAAGYLAAPGEHAGPCFEYCQHSDCQATRAMAQTGCYMCQEAIGYGVGFYNDPELGLVHRLCYLRSLEHDKRIEPVTARRRGTVPPSLDEYDRARREQEAQDNGEEENREKP